jgi:hypothetical protein
MMKHIFVPTVSGSDWQRLLAKPTLHWKRGRSAMTAAACWEASEPELPQEISANLTRSGDPDLLDLELLAAIPEWETSLPGGVRASQTDVLAITRNDRGLVVLAVEAKVDEPFGPTVGEKRAGASSGQMKRLAYLERQLGVSESLQEAIRYQLVHRTVAAFLSARSFHARAAVMLVHSFSPANKWREDFDAFVEAVGAQPVTPDLYELTVDEGQRLLVGWCGGSLEYLEVELPSGL